MLEIRNLRKSFKNKCVLQDISFSINKGEIVCLLGNNGAGKTTILNCILKMIKPENGEILFEGIQIDSIKNNQYFSMVSALLESSVNIYDYLTGWQNIEYFAGLLNLDAKGLKKANQYIDEFELRDSIDQPAGEYSRGMQQKLALVIALMSSPRLLLLDEPTLGLDIKSKISVIQILNRVVLEEEIGVILTTHQMDIVEKLNGHILLLKNGKIEEFDTNQRSEYDNYIVSYFNAEGVVHESATGSFSDIYSKYKDKEIVEIRIQERDIERIIMEELDETSNSGV